MVAPRPRERCLPGGESRSRGTKAGAAGVCFYVPWGSAALGLESGIEGVSMGRYG